MKNLIDQTVENKLVSDIKKLKDVALKIRQKQDIGADAIQIVISNIATLDFTLGAGELLSFLNIVTPADAFLSVWNLLRTLEANNTGQPLKHWPEENDDSAHNLGDVIRFEGGKDLANSSDVTGVRAAIFIVVNNDSHTLDFTYSGKWYGTQQAI